jgi:hypothetical protein
MVNDEFYKNIEQDEQILEIISKKIKEYFEEINLEDISSINKLKKEINKVEFQDGDLIDLETSKLLDLCIYQEQILDGRVPSMSWSELEEKMQENALKGLEEIFSVIMETQLELLKIFMKKNDLDFDLVVEENVFDKEELEETQSIKDGWLMTYKDEDDIVYEVYKFIFDFSEYKYFLYFVKEAN